MSDRPDLAALLADLGAEQADLRGLVDGAALDLPTPARPWDVHDTVAHLAASDVEATVAATDPERFRAGLAALGDGVQHLVDGQLAERRGLTRDALLTGWDTGFRAMLAAFAQLPEGTRIPWYGPPMSPASFATARLMEYWAHGQDVADALGVRRVPTARLRHVCHLGVRTRGFAYANRGLAVPPGELRVALTAPDGSTWSWGSGPDAVTGSAEDFCLLVTQRRHRADLDLVASGPLAEGFLEVAQAFAGPPGPGRPPAARA